MSSNMHRAQLPETGETRWHPAAASPGAGHRAGRVEQKELPLSGTSQLGHGVVSLGQWSSNFVKALGIL